MEYAAPFSHFPLLPGPLAPILPQNCFRVLILLFKALLYVADFFFSRKLFCPSAQPERRLSRAATNPAFLPGFLTLPWASNC